MTACTFPNSMVDRITPATTDDDRAWLAREHGIVDRWPVVAEPFRQWVLEDRFANGRPSWEAAGAVFTDDVESWELYKLRLLNAGHSSMAYLCALAGITLRRRGDRRLPRCVASSRRCSSRRRSRRCTGSPAARRRSTSPRSCTGSRTPACATRSPGCASTARRSSRRSSCPRSSTSSPTTGRSSCAALALAGWARYLGVVPSPSRRPTRPPGRARALAAAARTDPARFLELDGVMTAAAAGERAVPGRVRRRVSCRRRRRPAGGDGGARRLRDRDRRHGVEPSP